ncbi:UNVERIFIED_CONTAM: hypothetical protein PYX00_004385 [Menopon gallinae]|uniref:ENTH domain-containing protein n=1 Tax=Menopon gallinae TaxID=328185 RepID=A0AAW2I627_9NEOP
MFSMWKVREIADKVTNVVMNYTEIEAKVREATNDDAWGPTGALMQEIAQATFTYEHFPEVMSMLWKRMLQDNKTNWRRTYKSLLLLNYLIRNGSERVVSSSREHIYDLRLLENYTFLDEYGKDQGINIRHKVKELIDFIQDDDRLRDERKKAKKNKDKYVGLSSDARMGRYGRDHWDDVGRSDWDSERRHSSGFQDSSNNSDEGEKYDSDVETNETNKSSSYRDNCDSLSIESNSKKIDLKNNINSNTSTPSKCVKTVKKIDLGAAANYGVSSSSTATKPSNVDLFSLEDDDFNPRASDSQQEFGSFTSAFNNTTPPNNKKSDDNFADFAFAFTDNNQVATQPNNNSNLLNNTGSTSLAFDQINFIQNSVGSTPKKSNTDLLTGMGDMQSSAFKNSLENADAKNIQEDLHRHYSSLRASLTEVKKRDELLTEKEESKSDVRSDINFFVGLIPGLLTPQKLLGVDEPPEDVTYFMKHYHELVIRDIAKNLKSISCDLDPIIRLFCIQDGTLDTLLAILNVLMDGINSTHSPSNIMDLLLHITEKVIRGDLISAAIIRASLQDKLEPVDVEDPIQTLISLPERIANRTKGKNCDFFLKYFSNILYFHNGNVLSLLSDVKRTTGKCANPVCLSVVFSKILTRFQREKGLVIFVEFMEVNVQNDDDFRATAQEVLSHLNRAALEALSKVVLDVCRGPKSVHRILADIPQTNPDLRHILCTKIPLMTFMDTKKHPKFLKNLVGYLNIVSKSLVTELLKKTLQIWSNKSSINQTPTVQHEYITEIIILCGKIASDKMNREDKDVIRRLIFDGVPIHLESCDEEVRAIGMVTAEALVPYFLETTPESALKFDYEQFSESTRAMVDYLRDLEVTEEEEIDVDGCEKLLSLLTLGESVFVPVSKTVPVETVTKHEEKKDSDESDLDSDDDLPPYDTSNDKKTSKIPPPKYLRDLIDGLADRQNIEKFAVCIENALDIINSQLSSDHYKIGIELLQIFMSTDNTFNLENFASVKFNSCIDIVCAHPVQCAEFIGNEFNAEQTKYSVSDRIFMLDVLSSAARKLSESENDAEPEEKFSRRSFLTRQKVWEKVVRERILANTRRFISKAPQRKPGRKNEYHKVAGFFFFPLVRTFGIAKWNLYKTRKIDTVQDEVLLLTRFLQTVSVITLTAKNAPICRRICEEVMALISHLKFHEEGRVRLAVMSCLASVLLTTPDAEDMLEELVMCEEWLQHCKEDPDASCRSFARFLLTIVRETFEQNPFFLSPPTRLNIVHT